MLADSAPPAVVKKWPNSPTISKIKSLGKKAAKLKISSDYNYWLYTRLGSSVSNSTLSTLVLVIVVVKTKVTHSLMTKTRVWQ